MNEDFVYILYPIKASKLKELGIGFGEEKIVGVETADEENFMPLWYGNAKFPEDE